ncbi:uncharacterized protein LOC129950751 [Eupeodes corollae]|uniref:uncharacterized protein LOC129950751 n=1 Tax=Eupeodes corollae TaxID=290404 RepID=UPI00248FF251|nr:uncharacterized protein LOC129950751 [Eupeodes corollae]
MPINRTPPPVSQGNDNEAGHPIQDDDQNELQQHQPQQEQQHHQAPRNKTPKARRNPAKCRICGEGYNQEMVFCDGVCKHWYHYICVDISRSQAEIISKWFCEECSILNLRKIDALHIKLINQMKVVEKNVLEKKRKTVINNSYKKWLGFKEDYINLKGSFVDCQGAPLPEPRLVSVGSTGLHNESDRRSVSSISSSSTQRNLRLNLIQQRRDILREQRDNLQKEQELLKRQEEFIDEMSESEDDVGWINDEVPIRSSRNQVMNPSAPAFKPSSTTAFKRIPTPMLHQPTVFELPTPLSQRELAARKVYRELPTFTGNPEEWPLFKRMFDQSTQACGYSIDENLMRLQQALKGRARNLVSGQLAEPSCVPQIIKSLEIAFGQPNVILESQLEKFAKLSVVKPDKLESILEFSTAVTNLNAVMKASGLASQYDNPLLLKELLKKLTNDMKMKWATFSMDREVKGVIAFGSWLELEAKKVYEVLPISELSISRREVVHNEKSNSKSRVNVHIQAKPYSTCLVCASQCKSLEACDVFKQMSSLARWEKVKELRLCRQCLTAHAIKYPFVCKKAVKCSFTGCTRKHHPLMHQDVISTTPIVVTSQNSHTNEGDCFQFQYIPVTLRKGDKRVTTLAFLDGGSSGTRIEESVANELGLNGPKVVLHLKWTADVRRQEDSTKVSMVISGVYEGAKEFEIPVAHTIKELGLPRQTLKYDDLARVHPHLRGLPVNSYIQEQPRIMIGLSDWHLAVPSRTRLAEWNDPVATKCKLGWSVFGSSSSSKSQNINYHIEEYSHPDDENLDDMMRHFFSVDSLGVKIPKYDLISKEESRAKMIMDETTKFDKNRFETGLLWRYDDPVLPDSRPMANFRLLSLNRRLQKNPKLKSDMQNQIDDYIKKGYVRKLSAEELRQNHKRIWYLPLFPVVNPNKPERLRVVWDAAAKVNGVSLNSLLLKGPDALPALLGILMRFRENAVAISGDISEMFHQIKILPKDQHACRFLWDDGNGEAVYITQVMTFGATCSPSSAQFVKNLNAKKYEKDYPRAVEAIIKNHYVDDLLDSLRTPEEAIALAKDVKMIHKAGGFHIRKWKSNSREVMAALGEESSEVSDNFDLDKETVYYTEKVLGMWWDTKTDSLTYSLKFNKGNKDVLSGDRKPTKREVLRVMMSIFDPLGLIGHFTSYLKVLMQEVWRSGVHWDDEIEDDHQESWLRWLNELKQVESVLIPRCYLAESTWDLAETELHVFVDASNTCSATVANLRIQSKDNITCSLLGSKTKVAPIKLMSIPRLELVAALIGARFANSIRQSLAIRIHRVVFWSDSVTVLSWLRTDAKSVKGQFVAFRIAEVQEISNIANWRYVPSEMNPADDATKWKKGPSLNMTDRWMQAPQFLYESELEWPEDISLHQERHHTAVETLHQTTEPVISIKRFENWNKMLRVTAFVCRYIDALGGTTRGNDSFSSQEYQRAERVIFRIIQLEGLSSEVNYLSKPENLISKKKRPHSASNIFSMKPYLDENRVIRSLSRIDNASCLSFNSRRPIILPHDHHGTLLLVRNYHEIFRHINHETVVNQLRKKYYIPRIRQVLKRARKLCNRCKIRMANSTPPEMAVLPEVRVEAFTPPFSNTAVDYGGPFEIVNSRKVEKRWICLFTCLVTRAIHIEIAYSCSADSFILCYRNFLCRRGSVRKMFSDRGTNFIGAEKLLKTSLKSVDHQLIAEKFVNSELEWHFHPPASPHMNGCCERLIKSVKIALYAVSNVTSYKPNDELFRSFLMEVEDMINSRPLTYLPLDSEQSEAITPNHFLRQSPGGMIPLGNFNDDTKLHKSNLLMSQLHARHFWKRWIAEYLPTLTRREKWDMQTEPLAVGDIVLIIDERSPRNQWQKGKIIKVNATKDGQVRSATVQTESGIYQRPSVKLAKLNISAKEEVHL